MFLFIEGGGCFVSVEVLVGLSSEYSLIYCKNIYYTLRFRSVVSYH
jgi:hypothetical protein